MQGKTSLQSWRPAVRRPRPEAECRKRISRPGDAPFLINTGWGCEARQPGAAHTSAESGRLVGASVRPVGRHELARGSFCLKGPVVRDTREHFRRLRSCVRPRRNLWSPARASGAPGAKEGPDFPLRTHFLPIVHAPEVVKISILGSSEDSFMKRFITVNFGSL